MDYCGEKVATDGVSRATLDTDPKPYRYPVRVPLPSLGRLSTKTNLKAVNPGRHRNSPAREAETAVDDHELTSYLAALAPDADDPESTGTGRRFGEAQVFQIRMNTIASEQLKDLAAERETSPQALAMEWVLERLSWEAQASSAQDQTQSRHNRVSDAHTDQFTFDQNWEQPVSGRLR